MNSVYATVNIGRGATGGITDDVADAISPGASETVEQNETIQAVGATATLVTGGGTLAQTTKSVKVTAGRFTRGKAGHVRNCLRSFSGSTYVLMGDGTKRAISLVRVGDLVMAADAQGNDPKPRLVTAVWQHADKLMYLYTDAGRITTTSDHPFFNVSGGDYAEASRLPFGTSLSTPSGATVRSWGHGPENMVGAAYNLTVEDRHTYYVSTGKASVLVHNVCPDDYPGNRTPPGWKPGADRDIPTPTRPMPDVPKPPGPRDVADPAHPIWSPWRPDYIGGS